MSTLQIVLSQNNYTLLTGIQYNALVLRVQVNQGHKKQIYECRLKLHDFKYLEKLASNFDSFQDLIQYIKKQPSKHVDIDFKGKMINIVAKVGNKKVSAIQLGSIPIQLIQSEEIVPKQRDISAVFKYCQQTQSSSFSLIRPNLLILAKNIQYLLGQLKTLKKQSKQKQKKEQIQIQQNHYSQNSTKQEQAKQQKPKQCQINDQQRQKIDIMISEMQNKIQKMEYQKINRTQIFNQIKTFKQLSNSVQVKVNQQVGSLKNYITDIMNKMRYLENSLSQKSNKKQIEAIMTENAKIQQKCMKEIAQVKENSANKKIKQQVLSIMKQNEQKLTKLLTNEFENKINSNNTQFEKKLKAFSTQAVQLSTESLSKNLLSSLSKRLAILQQSKQSQSQTTLIKKQQIPSISSSLSAQWVDNTCYFYDSLSLQSNTIVASSGAAHIFGYKQISNKYSYTVQLINIKYDTVIGIIDIKYREMSKFSYGCLPGCIVYGNKGYAWNDKDQENQVGFMYKVGEKVTVIIDKAQKMVQWRVDNKMRHRTKSDSLHKANIIWVPYIYLGQKGDKVAISQ